MESYTACKSSLQIWCFPFLGQVTARQQALQSGKSAQRSFSMQHPATGMALSLGACSGNNTTGTSSGTTPPTDQNGGSNGDGSGDGDGGTKSSELQAARTAFTAAEMAVMEATAAATAAETAGTEAARANARTKIAAARTALALAVSRAQAAYNAAQVGTDDPALGAAKIVLDRVTAYQTAELAKLSTAEALPFWFTGALARQAIADGDVQVPSENTNAATIERTPRTKDTSTTDDTQIPNTAPKPIDGGTFKLVPYASGKKVFSRDAKHSGAETFKVDGYSDWLNSNQASDSTSYTGLQLTGDGLVIRFGGNGKQYPDTKQKLDTATVTDNAASDVGENGWDLTITFDGPDTLSAEKGVRSRQGNGDFYWKARVETVASQQRAGANCVASVLTPITKTLKTSAHTRFGCPITSAWTRISKTRTIRLPRRATTTLCGFPSFRRRSSAYRASARCPARRARAPRALRPALRISGRARASPRPALNLKPNLLCLDIPDRNCGNIGTLLFASRVFAAPSARMPASLRRPSGHSAGESTPEPPRRRNSSAGGAPARSCRNWRRPHGGFPHRA